MFLVSCTKSHVTGTPVKDSERDFTWSFCQMSNTGQKIYL